MSNDPNMAEAISDVYSDCEKQARAEAQEFEEGRLDKDDAPSESDAEILARWAKYKRNVQTYVPTRTMQLLHASEHKLRIIHGPVGCVSCDTEVMTPGGWVRIDQWNGEEIAQSDFPSGGISFVKPIEYIRSPCVEKMLKISDASGCSMIVTKNHRVPFWHKLRSGKEVFGVLQAQEFVDAGLGRIKQVRIPTLSSTGRLFDCCSIEEFESPDGMQYCFTVPTSFFVARHNGFVFVTGNSGKSYGVTMDVPLRCASQSPCADGVIRNRALFARNIYQQLKQTTFEVWMRLFPSTRIALSSPIQGSLDLKLGNRKMVIDLIGLGTDTQSAEATLRSNGFSIARVEEIQYISYRMICFMQERLGRYPDIPMAPAGRRVPGYFKNLGLSADTNMPVEGSWLWDRAQNVRDPSELYLFQPPAMFRTWNAVTKTWDYEENRGQRQGVYAAENVEHLLEGWDYYWTQIRVKSDDDIRRNVLNEYGHILSGTPVYPEFSKEKHVCAKGVPLPPRGARIYCGMDLGRHPRAVFAYNDPKNGGVRVFRILSKDCGVQMFAETVMRPNLMSWGISPHMVSIIPDPAGENKGEQVEATSVEILRTAGFDVAMPVLKNNDPFTRMETVRQALTRTAMDGDPYLTIDPSCEELIRALAGGYTYATIKTANGQERVSDKPDKGPYSHIGNALEYLLVGMKYGRRETTIHGGESTQGFSDWFKSASNGRSSDMFC